MWCIFFQLCVNENIEIPRYSSLIQNDLKDFQVEYKRISRSRSQKRSLMGITVFFFLSGLCISTDLQNFEIKKTIRKNSLMKKINRKVGTKWKICFRFKSWFLFFEFYNFIGEWKIIWWKWFPDQHPQRLYFNFHGSYIFVSELNHPTMTVNSQYILRCRSLSFSSFVNATIL